MTIHKNQRQKDVKKVRKWAKDRKEKIYEMNGNKCTVCDEEDKEKLTIHHQEYKIGYEYLKLWCNKCHRNYHQKELQKRILVMMIVDAKKYKNKFESNNLNYYIEDLQDRINDIKIKGEPVQLMKGIPIDGLPNEVEVN